MTEESCVMSIVMIWVRELLAKKNAAGIATNNQMN